MIPESNKDIRNKHFYSAICLACGLVGMLVATSSMESKDQVAKEYHLQAGASSHLVDILERSSENDTHLYAGVSAKLSTLLAKSSTKSPAVEILEETVVQAPEEPTAASNTEEPSVVTGEVETESEEPEEDVPYTNRWNIILTDDEYILFAKIVFRESGNQCLEGQEAVAEVILNRMYSDTYPDTLYEVLSQPHQFESWPLRNKGTVTELTYEACDRVLQGKTNITSYDYIAFSRGGHSNHSGSFRIQDHQFCTK